MNLATHGVLPLDCALNPELLRNYVLLLLGAFFILQRWVPTREAALFGAMLATFSGSSTHHH